MTGLFLQSSLVKDSLNVENLDMCCLGGSDWIFHHVSSRYEFTPTTKLQTYMNRHKKQKREVHEM